ncbi:Hypothetical protein A7982_11729 [Minicystis rosea]|nr:Hypothetical protein A7982_11729 [Minicystis rosea]
MMAKLVAEASGLRHLRWAREILGTLEAHHEHDGRLAQPERDLVLEESVKLRAQVNDLSAAVKAYRDFLERDRTRFRGMLRVAAHLAETARDDDERGEAEAIRSGFDEAFAAMEMRERLPRKQAVRDAVARLRDALSAMDARLASKVGDTFVESLYPALAASGTMVADVGDGDDDATAAAP